MVENKKSMVEVEAQQTKQGGVVPSKMQVGYSLLVETEDYMYRITRESNHWFVESGHALMRNNNMITAISSVDPSSLWGKDDWVGKDMRLTLVTPYGIALITKPVLSAVMCGEGFEVNIWD